MKKDHCETAAALCMLMQTFGRLL